MSGSRIPAPHPSSLLSPSAWEGDLAHCSQCLCFSRRERRDTWHRLSFAALPFIYCCCCCLGTQSCPSLEASWTVACQAPLFMAFSRQECWIGLSFPPPGDLLLDPGIKPASPALTGGFFIAEPPGKPLTMHNFFLKKEIFEDKRFFPLSCCILNISFKTLITFMNTFLDNDQNLYYFYCCF